MADVAYGGQRSRLSAQAPGPPLTRSYPADRMSLVAVAELEADYLVVGAGAAGMALTDALIDHADVSVVMVDPVRSRWALA